MKLKAHNRKRPVFKGDIAAEKISIWNKSSEIISRRLTTDHPGVNKCLDLIAEKFCRPIEVADLMKTAGLSRRGLIKAFQASLGATPGALLRYVRLQYAKRLLLEYDLDLTEITKMCGFRNRNTFSVAFLRAVGVSPKKFQTRYLLEVHRVSNTPKTFGMVQPGDARLFITGSGKGTTDIPMTSRVLT
jgi:AraC-like DNA-binding protein